MLQVIQSDNTATICCYSGWAIWHIFPVLSCAYVLSNNTNFTCALGLCCYFPSCGATMRCIMGEWFYCLYLVVLKLCRRATLDRFANFLVC